VWEQGDTVQPRIKRNDILHLPSICYLRFSNSGRCKAPVIISHLAPGNKITAGTASFIVSSLLLNFESASLEGRASCQRCSIIAKQGFFLGLLLGLLHIHMLAGRLGVTGQLDLLALHLHQQDLKCLSWKNMTGFSEKALLLGDTREREGVGKPGGRVTCVPAAPSEGSGSHQKRFQAIKPERLTCCATTGLALSPPFQAAPSFLPTRWCGLARTRCSRRLLAGPTGARLGGEAAGAPSAAAPAAGARPSPGGRDNETQHRDCTLPRYSHLLAKANRGQVWERPETAQQILRLRLRDRGFALSNGIG